MLGAVGGGSPFLSRVVDRATVGLCAEMLGGMTQIFDNTLEYLKTRTQFGALIGSFQALKHRAARLFMDIELARSTVMAAARAVDAGEAEAETLISLGQGALFGYLRAGRQRGRADARRDRDDG